MEKRKLSKSKITGTPPGNQNNPELNVIVQVREPNYIPEWVQARKQITDTLFTATITKADLSKLEADSQVISVSINEQLDPL